MKFSQVMLTAIPPSAATFTLLVISRRETTQLGVYVFRWFLLSLLLQQLRLSVCQTVLEAMVIIRWLRCMAGIPIFAKTLWSLSTNSKVSMEDGDEEISLPQGSLNCCHHRTHLMLLDAGWLPVSGGNP